MEGSGFIQKKWTWSGGGGVWSGTLEDFINNTLLLHTYAGHVLKKSFEPLSVTGIIEGPSPFEDFGFKGASKC
jgi:hypothetical protein